MQLSGKKRDLDQSGGLERRVREQAVLAQFTLDALQATSVQNLCDAAVQILRKSMGVDFSAIFERAPDGKSMMRRTGSGAPGRKKATTRIILSARTATARALRRNQPIVISDGRRGRQSSQYMNGPGVADSVAVVIPGSRNAFGILAVGTKSPHVIDANHVHFLESVGTVLATGISRLQFEHELRDTAARLRGIVETAVDGIITIDERGIVEAINPAAQRIFGYTAGEVIGRNVSMLMPEPHRSDHGGYIARYLRTGERRIIGIGREVRGCRKNGTEFPMDLAVSDTLVAGGRIFTGLIRDITERKRLEQEIIEISDHEQRRIGSDLHDDLCQRLAGIRFSCDALKRSLGKTTTESVSERVERIGHSLGEAIERTRSLARGLSPVALEANGLISALQELASEVRTKAGIECVFDSKGRVAVNDAMAATHLYRITQEAINNAIKHGRPSRLLVSLRRQGEKVVLKIEDNGAGFTAETRGHGAGMGLRTIAYRAGMIGADLEVKSKPDQGTRIFCTFRLKS
jgi:two-component system sensor kinase FixL